MDEMEKTDDALELLSEGIDLSEGIEKNLLKVMWKLSAGLLNIPLQKIERHLNERSVDSKARIANTQAVAQQITERIEVDEEYVKIAATKHAESIINKQINLDNIVAKTKEKFQNTPQDETQADHNIEEISDDWLNQFREFACQKSSEEAQDLFSKVLAGEIRKPGSFSLRALTTLSDMDQNVAMIFKAFCSLCLVNLDNPRMYHLTQSKSHFKIMDARIPFLSGGIEDIPIVSETHPRNLDSEGNRLSKFTNMSKSIYNIFGLHLSEFQLLSEYGLIDNSSHIEYNHFWYNNELWGFLQPDVNFSQSSEDYQNITISGYALTSVGKELFHITKRHAHPQYWKLLTDYLQKLYNITLYKMPKPQKKSSPDGSADQNTSNTL